jgi:nitrogen fixation-related uncharacterized protein
MVFYWIIILGSAICLSGSAVFALWWAATNNQLSHPKKGALLVFDEEEPMGIPTDHFPAKSTAVPPSETGRGGRSV